MHESYHINNRVERREQTKVELESALSASVTIWDILQAIDATALDHQPAT